jgi:drug/metabolite transporter (DMT)-like permease
LILPIKAFVLVLVASFAHATWNFLAKRASHNKHLIWFSSATEALLFAPIAIWILSGAWSILDRKAALFLLATGILHLLYTECLLRGYRIGDLTSIYPMTRGIAPLLSFLGAVLVLHEQPSMLAVLGALLISFGILVASGGLSAFRHRRSRVGLLWSIATGCTIAAYTLVDGYSVKTLLISPFLVEYAGTLFRVAVLSGGAWQERSWLRTEYRQCWKEAFGIGTLFPIAYLLVLFAMRFAPISHVAPVREMSMMVGMYFGAQFLSEKQVVRRIVGSAFIVLGVAALALG